jgi:hypothetical protein
VLKSAIRILEEEQRADFEMRNHFKEKWQRVPSDQLNKNLREAAKSFQEKLAAASKSDAVVKKKWEDNLPYVEMLCGTRVITICKFKNTVVK